MLTPKKCCHASLMRSLPADLFAEAFPFHVICDRSFRIIQVGEVLQRIMQRPLVGSLFAENFSIIRPKISLDFETMKQQHRTLFFLQSLHSNLQLRGPLIDVEEQDTIFFLGSPWITDLKQLSPLGLKLKDFAVSDPLVDFLFLIQSQNTALEEARKLAAVLAQQKIELQNALQLKEDLAIAEGQTELLQKTLNELQQAQAQLIQTEKMSSLGQMVAGVAHEINNPVNFIHGNLYYIDQYVKELLSVLQAYQRCYPQPQPEIVEMMEEVDIQFIREDLLKVLASMGSGTARIREIVKSLRNFSRLDEDGIKSVDLHDGIESTLLILQHQIKAKSDRPEIQIVRKYSKLPLVECNPRQLNQVFMNLLTNAIDALEEMNQEMNQDSNDDSEINLPTIIITSECLSEAEVSVIVADNGPGIPLEIQSKLFDPFFTTKAVGKGTGLGLTISYHVITESHSGTIQCQSELGQGTQFRVTLPVMRSLLQ